MLKSLDFWARERGRAVARGRQWGPMCPVASFVGTARRMSSFLVVSMIGSGDGVRQSPPPGSADQLLQTPIVATPFFKTRACLSVLELLQPCVAPRTTAPKMG